MVWNLVCLLVGFGFGKFGFAWIGGAYTWVRSQFAKPAA